MFSFAPTELERRRQACVQVVHRRVGLVVPEALEREGRQADRSREQEDRQERPPPGLGLARTAHGVTLTPRAALGPRARRGACRPHPWRRDSRSCRAPAGCVSCRSASQRQWRPDSSRLQYADRTSGVMQCCGRASTAPARRRARGRRSCAWCGWDARDATRPWASSSEGSRSRAARRGRGRDVRRRAGTWGVRCARTCVRMVRGASDGTRRSGRARTFRGRETAL